MAIGMKINTAELLLYTERQCAAGLKAAGLDLHRIARKAASVPNPGRRMKRTRATSRGKKGTQYTVYPHSAKGSATPPGESPHRRTGKGQKEIVWGFSRERMASRVGYTRAGRHMTYHELGIEYKQVGKQYRQTIMPSLATSLNRLAAVFRAAAQRVKP